MHLVQILLPLADNEGKPFPKPMLRAIQKELCDRFGGVTAYNRAPAEGVWKNGSTKTKDDIVILEVMTEELDEEWWGAFRKRLETKLGQKDLVVRSQSIEML